MKAEGQKIDPFTVTTNKDDWQKFRSLGFFEQLDASVNNASKPDIKNLPVFVIGLIWWCINAAGCLFLTWYTSGAELWSTAFHENLLKNVIAWDAIANHHGFALFYRPVIGSPEFNIKFKIGSIKETMFPSLLGSRRSMLDILLHLFYDGSRIWLLISVEPSPLCAWCVFGSVAAIYVFDFGEYVGMYGMYHGPWSVFILAKYYSTSQAPATAVMQFLLQLLYIGCGLGKMGPWFTSVFNQEWTLPPWALKFNIASLLYKNDFPKDNTPSLIGSILAYLAASSEWIAPLLMLCTSAVVGGPTNTAYVRLGVITLISMHLYINFHMPLFDVWMLNMTPAYIVYNVYYVSPHISEPGFDYELFSQLHPAFQAFCWFMVGYCIFGQCFPGKMTYMHCYRFWAGNWPQSWVLVSEQGLAKLKRHFPSQAKSGLPGENFAKLQGPLWAFNIFGIMQTAQLPQRIIPKLMHKGLVVGASLRGENVPTSLTDFQDKYQGVFMHGCTFFNWASGSMVNDALRGAHVLTEMHKRCNFAPGECMVMFSNSFPIFAGLTGSRSHWTITDANKGMLEEGYVTVKDALAITRPSMLKGYDKRSSFKGHGKRSS